MAFHADIVVHAPDPQVEAVLEALPPEDHHRRGRVVADVSDHRSPPEHRPGRLSTFPAGRRIRDSIAADFREFRHFVSLSRVKTENVRDGDASGDEGIREQRPMALPRDGLGAHDGSAVRREESQEAIGLSPKLGGGHVIRVAAKARIPPARVAAVNESLAESAQAREVHVSDSTGR